MCTCSWSLLTTYLIFSFKKIFFHVVEEFEIIETSVIDQLGTLWQSPEDKKSPKKKKREEELCQSPRSKARQRWRNAIKQQIMLNQMERKNELVKRKLKKERENI